MKKLPKLQPGDLIEVVWDDATGDAGWVVRREIEWPEMSCTTCGYYVQHDDRALMLIDSFFADHEEKDGVVGGMKTIPTPWVTKITVVKRAKRCSTPAARRKKTSRRGKAGK